MTHSLEIRIKSAFVLLLVALLGTGLVLYRTTTHIIADGEWLDHTHAVMAMLERTAAVLTQAGAVVRTALLTGDSGNMQQDFNAVDRQLEKLKALTADNPSQQARVVAIQKEWPERRNAMMDLIHLRAAKGLDSVWDRLKAAQKNPQPSQISDSLVAMRQEEQRLLEIRTKKLKIGWGTAKLTFVVLAVLAGVAFVFVWYLLGRYLIEQRQSQAALAHERGLLRTLIDNMPDFIFAKDTQSRLILTNISHSRALGAASPAAALGQTDAAFLPEEMAKKTLANEQSLIQSGEVFNEEEQFIDSNGKRKWLSTIKVPLRGNSGEIVGLVGMSRNIEEFKLLERSLESKVQERTLALSNVNKILEGEIGERKLLDHQLRQRNAELEEQNQRVLEANRHKSEFLANMSHELRTPLNCIIGFSELMHDGKVGSVSPEHKEFLADILSTSRHLLDLINGVLDLAKVESGKMEFSPEPTDVNKLICGVAEVLRNLGAKKRIQVGIEVDPLLEEVVTDPSKFKQIVYNYLSNALKFTPDGGRVTIRARAEGTKFRLEVEDTGCGISPEDQKRLFAEFVQLDGGTTKKHEGTGLGLVLTRRIVEGQGGEVGVASAPGGGSLFYAVLPLGTRVAVTPFKSARPAPQGATVVLVVEDEKKEQAWLVQQLTEAGYSVQTAASAGEALSKTRTTHFDAITLDLMLANESGWDLLSAIRSEGPNHDTPVVVVTIVREKEAGACFRIDDFLTKPVEADQLISSLRRVGVPPEKSQVILAVDDDPATLRLVEATLGEAGYQAVCRNGGAAGLEAAKQEPPCAVILDLLMPDMDGMEFLKRFRKMEHCKNVPVMIWTSKDMNPSEIASLREQAQGVAFKDRGGATSLLAELVPLLQDRRCAPAA